MESGTVGRRPAVPLVKQRKRLFQWEETISTVIQVLFDNIHTLRYVLRMFQNLEVISCVIELYNSNKISALNLFYVW